MQTLDRLLGIEHPIMMAPMFLVSSEAMLAAGLLRGITGVLPAMNFRREGELYAVVERLKSTGRPFGINLITNRSNAFYGRQLSELLMSGPAFAVSSLGSPKELISEAHRRGIMVFCDVVDVDYARKAESLGADALIAVNALAGGHCGRFLPEQLLPMLRRHCSVPIISAGGVANHSQVEAMLNLGAAGVSVGTVFIASRECPVANDYKQAIVEHGQNDIVLTTKLSGAPTAVINTDYVKKIGTKANLFEYLVNHNRPLKRFAKKILSQKGMRKLRKAAFKATYKTIYVAGQSIEYVHAIRPINDIIDDLTGNSATT